MDEFEDLYEEETMLEDERLNDSVIETVEQIDKNLKITLKTSDEETIIILCKNVVIEKSIMPEGMVIFGIEKEEQEDGQIFVEFINWYERDDEKGKSELRFVCSEISFDNMISE